MVAATVVAGAAAVAARMTVAVVGSSAVAVVGFVAADCSCSRALVARGDHGQGPRRR